MGVYLFVCLLYLFFLYTDCLPSNLCTVKLLRVIKECLILFGFNIFQNLPESWVDRPAVRITAGKISGRKKVEEDGRTGNS